MSRVTAPEGNSVSYTYDTRGNITQTRIVSKTPGTPADIVTSAVYPATCTNIKICNKPTSTTDANGSVTNYDYDAVTGQVLGVTQPSATAGGARPQTRYGYYRDSVSGVTLLQTVSTCRTQASCSGTADETRTTLTYNTNLLPATVTIAGGDGTLSATTTLSYDNVGNLASVDGPLPGAGDTTVYRYDAARQRVGVIGPDPDGSGPLRNPAQKIDYNLDGQVIAQSEGVTNGQTDAAWSGFAVQRSMAATYDTLGRPVQQRILDSTGAIQALSQASYDALGRVDCVAQRMNPATYGALPAACTLASGGSAGPDRISKTSYDLAGRVLSTTTGFGTSAAVTQSQTFTANGQVETVSDGKGNKTTYEYDGFDRLVRTRYPDPAIAGVSSATDSEALTYDPNGNITTQRTRDNRTTRFSYDALNRLTLRDFDNGNTGADINYSYDLGGRLLSAYFGNGSTIGMTYDALGRLVSQANYSRTIGFQYDAAGRRTRLQYPDGFFVDYDYDLLGRTTAIRENGATSGVGVLARYAYADDGSLATLTRGNGTTTAVQVDGIGRLARLTHDFAGTAQDWQASFSYTPSSQIASRSQVNDAVYAWRGHYNVNRSYTANGLNQLTTSGPLTLTYVNVSNLKSDGTWTYNYDTENKLRKVTRPGVVVQLNYDPFDRLFVTTATPGTLTKFLYDGDALIGEYDTNDQLQQRTVHGPGVDAPLVRYDAAGVRRWLHADERGSVVAESDASGLVVATYSYGPYGEPDSTAGGRLRYTGQMLIPELGLYHYRARTYSAYLGRFLQADPAGTADGLNLYAYVGNDPINATDPSGMFRLSDLFHSSFLPRFDSSSSGGGGSGGEEVTDFGETVVVGKKYTFSPFIRLSGSGGGGGGYINEPREINDKQEKDKQCSSSPSDGIVGSARAVLEATATGADVATIGFAAAGITAPVAIATKLVGFSAEAALAGVNAYDGFANGNWGALQAQGAGLGARLIPGGRALQSGLKAVRGPTGILRNSAGRFRSSYLNNAGIEQAGQIATERGTNVIAEAVVCR